MTCRARKFRAASRRRAKSIRRGFTLLEVMAAVLVLGLLYTVLANRALIGLRSEGIDRRRANAEMIADRELTSIESELTGGLPLEDGLVEREEDLYKVISNVEPFDALSLLPAPVYKDIARTTDPKAPSLLHDDRGQSRLRKISVVVEWDEAGEPDHVERTTFAFDTSRLAELFPATASETGEATGSPESEIEKVRRAAPPELKALMGAPKAGGGGRANRSRQGRSR